MTARQESEAEWYRAIEIGMIEQEKLDDYRHEQELEVLRANLQELNRLLHATDETRRENLNMACRPQDGATCSLPNGTRAARRSQRSRT